MISNLNKRFATNASPVQPWIISKSKNYKQSTFQLNAVSNKSTAIFYEFETDEFINFLRVPDACMNIFFEISNDSNYATISGIYDKSSYLKLNPNTSYFGLNLFSPFGMRGWKISPYELFNKTCKLSDVLFSENLTSLLNHSSCFNERISILTNFYSRFWLDINYSPCLAEYCSILVCTYSPNKSINKIEEDTGFTDRHCRSSFKNLYNCSLKTYSKIIRFQNSLQGLLYLPEEPNSIARIAVELGFYDESHFIKDFKSFVEKTPKQLKESFYSLRS